MQSKWTNQKIPVPCGKCPSCLKRKTSGWSFRLIKEGDISKSALFVTLTYENENLHYTEKGFKNLSKTDVQKFFKRLRKLSSNKLKYYAVGEYGSKTWRPHYHIILFNANREIVHKAWMLDNKPIGSIFIGDVTDASIGYTLKYMSKKGKIPVHKNDDRQKEFQLMSKGLGKNYLTEKMIRWHKDDLENRMYVPMKDNKKIAMPRYYKDKLYSESEKNRIVRHMEDIMLESDEKEMEKHGKNYFSYLAERHLNLFRQMHKKSKENEKI
jgi:hypothetical protein